ADEVLEGDSGGFGDAAEQQHRYVAHPGFELCDVAFRNVGRLRQDFAGHAVQGANPAHPLPDLGEELFVSRVACRRNLVLALIRAVLLAPARLTSRLGSDLVDHPARSWLEK